MHVMRIALGLCIVLLSFPTAAADAAVSIVQRLYQDFAWETVIAEPTEPGLIDQPREVLKEYFDERLTALIIEDRRCAEITHEICRLDFMPLWDAQDIGATDLAIHPTPDPSRVEVTFRFAGAKVETKLTYQLVRSTAGWRISNITSPAWSLLEVLTRKP
jgi:hypothetical protein